MGNMKIVSILLSSTPKGATYTAATYLFYYTDPNSTSMDWAVPFTAERGKLAKEYERAVIEALRTIYTYSNQSGLQL
jgi:hypothetical protein